MRVITVVGLMLAFICSALAQGRITSKEEMIKKAWIIKKEEVYSPWNVNIVPIIIDFSCKESRVIIRGYGKGSERENDYVLKEDSLLIDGKISYKIKSLKESVLVLNINGSDVTYFSMHPGKNSTDSTALLKVLAVKSRWQLGGNHLEFTDQEVKLTPERTYQAIEYRNGRKYFGTYFIDSYLGNLFLIILIDGKYKEQLFQVLSFNATTVELTEIDYGKSDVNMVLARK